MVQFACGDIVALFCSGVMEHLWVMPGLRKYATLAREASLSNGVVMSAERSLGRDPNGTEIGVVIPATSGMTEWGTWFTKSLPYGCDSVLLNSGHQRWSDPKPV